MYLLHCVASGAEQDYRGFAIYCIIYSLWTEKGSETGLVTVIMERCGEAHLEKKPPSLCLVQRGQLEESWPLLFTVFWSTSVRSCPSPLRKSVWKRYSQQNWCQPRVSSCWSYDKEFKNLEQLLLLLNQLSNLPMQSPLRSSSEWEGKWLLRAENKLYSIIFTWNSIYKMHWKRFFFKHQKVF